MHAEERENAILNALQRTSFVTYRDLESALEASPATIRRDLARLESEQKLIRVHGGAKAAGEDQHRGNGLALKGTPFDTALHENLAAKRAVAKAAAGLCQPGEGIIIDGGSTTFQMCEYLAGLGLQVLTNSLHIVDALLPQPDTQVLVPSGTIFREQNIILAPSGEASMPNVHAKKLFIGAAAVSERGIFQADAILVTSQRRLLDLADEVILLVDSTKLASSSGAIVCGLERITRLITDKEATTDLLERLSECAPLEIQIARDW